MAGGRRYSRRGVAGRRGGSRQAGRTVSVKKAVENPGGIRYAKARAQA